ncbi:MAG: PKD domain-containing protein [Flammeovirgaceae bacterium]|nr:PKD domain-containing protein [Flammeovirgaceae bacterium]
MTLTAFGSSGCNSTASKSVSIRSKPVADFEVALPPFSCSGTPSQFNDLTPNPTDSNIAGWLWNFDDVAGGNNSSTVKNPNHVYSSAGTYDVSLITTTNFGCKDTIQKQIEIFQTPFVDFNFSAPCANKPVVFTDVTAGSNTAWLWQIDNATYTSQQSMHTFSSAGDFNASLNVTSSNGCIGMTTKQVGVVQSPQAGFETSNEIGIPPLLVQFTNTSVGAVDFLWKFNDPLNSMSTDVSPAFTFVEVGDYDVELTATSTEGCTSTYSKLIQVTEPTPIESEFSNGFFSLNPNPAQTFTVITGFNPRGNPIVVSIFNLSGMEVFRQEIKDHNSIRADLSAVAAGIYLFKIDLGGQRMISRLAIKK